MDILEIIKFDTFELVNSGIKIPDGENICEKMEITSKRLRNRNVRIHLHKQIPIGGGLGGVLDKLFYIKSIK